MKPVNKKCKKSLLENKLYQEFDVNGNVLFSIKLKHDKSVTFKLSENGIIEYDQYGRMTYTKDSSGYWALRFFDEPISPDRVNNKPYQVVHKYWEHYNN